MSVPRSLSLSARKHNIKKHQPTFDCFFFRLAPTIEEIGNANREREYWEEGAEKK